MREETRTLILDQDLQVEAYRFKGIMQKFPNHFHEYYVIGFIEKGQRYLLCQGQEYIINPGDLLLFNPHDTHSCEQIDGKALDYRSINVMPDVMEKAVKEITGAESLPYFTQNVLFRHELTSSLKELHVQILQKEKALQKEELFLNLLEELIRTYSDVTFLERAPEPSDEVKTVCGYLEEHYTENIKLDDLSGLTGWSKYHLLRSFTKQKGISPYSYLETVRINQAKKLLEQGVKPIDAAFQTGFSDQSHLTKFFKRQVGLTPKQYMKIFEQDRLEIEG
ncbi:MULTISPECIES: AraC family ligand binding domain-containing protein [Bacillus]|uniref:AraC family transcriptional regulator n=1 Tax=Bacillus glycinifermentans TaxID=1664069 RepID=A0AAJ3YVG4_9BACI|nr:MULTISPECIES: AraC family transcriptional regulator [Bacillus]KKB75508.1 AraC family transcriptional regulator [Bacillus sp. TH008]MBU8785846.1 AraC family transcriptional regulator [Bacillus glycinifermentans]MDU0071202.1 AraC family transcriptional regulator [Bacillus sp. IG6]MED8019070.1 AraC family transcriptional regulator [Bacillus glycinifermentans]QAT63741.1 AraC family transcriptional regulator [Bacillus glycinifermentans]